VAFREQVRVLQPLRGVRVVGLPVDPDVAETEMRIKEAYKKGFAEASDGINQQILEQRNEVNELRARLFRSLEESISTAVAEVREALPVLTMQAVRRVLSKVDIKQETVAAVIEELLSEIGPDVGPIELRLHTVDLKLVEDLEPQLAKNHPGLRLVADEKLSRGDCQAVTLFGKVDARIENKLGKIAASLGLEP
jgi:flagellar assembly protein FliH